MFEIGAKCLNPWKLDRQLPITLWSTTPVAEWLRPGGDLAPPKVDLGSAAPVRDHEMQPFAFEIVRVGICDP
jgi:hypothetical protein